LPRYFASGGGVSTSARANAGTGITLVELIPTQLQQLAQMLSTSLSVDGKVIAQAADNSNVAQAARGAN
jgi:hypothetical protein